MNAHTLDLLLALCVAALSLYALGKLHAMVRDQRPPPPELPPARAYLRHWRTLCNEIDAEDPS